MDHSNVVRPRKLNEEGVKNNIDHVFGSSVRVIQEKYMYNLKDAAVEFRNKPARKSVFGSDSLILNPLDLRRNSRLVFYF